MGGGKRIRKTSRPPHIQSNFAIFQEKCCTNFFDTSLTLSAYALFLTNNRKAAGGVGDGGRGLNKYFGTSLVQTRVAEVVRRHEGPSPKSLILDGNF